jgi:hypothetical protein
MVSEVLDEGLYIFYELVDGCGYCHSLFMIVLSSCG